MTILKTLAICGMLLAGAVRAESPFAGTWQGKMHDLPAVTVTFHDDGGKINGIITFYLLTRANENDPWHVEGEDTEPLLDAQSDGMTLRCEVRHHKFHGSAEYGPNVKMMIELAGDGRAKLGDVVLRREK